MYGINDINCWAVNIKPFDDKSTSEDTIREFQFKCIENNIFGIGWHKEGFTGSLEDNRDAFLDASSEDSKYKSIVRAVNNMSKIKEGDLIIMRLRNAHYYIGMVSNKAFYKSGIFENNDFDKILSWMCLVHEWFEFQTDEMLPSEIVGRMSIRRQPTLSRVANSRQKMLIAAAFNILSNQKIGGVSKINFSIDNFAGSLNYTELEDLVCSYIYRDIQRQYPQSDYMLLPSSCKVSHPLYEFVFVCPGARPITCQVKNNAVIDIEKYNDDYYRKIYLFSNQGYVNEKSKHDNIEIIDREKLFDFLLDNTEYIHRKLSEYYTFDGTGIDL